MSKKRTPKRPRDVNEMAFRIGQIATHEVTEETGPTPDTRAVARGKARAASLSGKRRKAIAKKAAAARWKRNG